MPFEPQEYHTSIATLKVVSPQLIEIHYKEHIILHVKAVAEVQAKRRELMGTQPYVALTIIPESVDFHLDAMAEDHRKMDRVDGELFASAVVAKAILMQRLSDLYFTYFPQLQRLLVTHDEQEARTWIAKQLEDMALTGS